MRYIIIALLSLFVISCGPTHPEYKDTTEAKEPKIKPYTVQVVNEYGYVENIEDNVRLRPRIGDTIIVCNIDRLRSDSTIYSNTSIWGILPKNGKIPESLETDSLSIEYYPARVIKTVILDL